jgi:inactivated superfamily I helicase
LNNYHSKIFNIPANYCFIDSFVDWLDKKFISDVDSQDLPPLIFITNKTAIPDLQQSLLLKFNAIKDSQGFDDKSFLMPNIKAISNFSITDLFEIFDINQNNSQEVLLYVAELLQYQQLTDIDFTIFLAKIIKNIEDFSFYDFDICLSIATDLTEVFARIMQNDINLKELCDKKFEYLSKHHQKIITVLEKVFVNIESYKQEQNLVNRSAYQNLLLSTFIKINKVANFKRNIIILGSTGSTDFSRQFIKVILESGVNQKICGYLVVYAANLRNYHKFYCQYKAGNIDNWQINSQFYLYQLFAFLDIVPDEVNKKVSEIAIASRMVSSDIWSDFTIKAIDSQVSVDSFSINFDSGKFAELNNAINDKITIINAINQYDEAKTIVNTIISYLLQNPSRSLKVNIVVNDKNLLTAIVNELFVAKLPYENNFSSNLANHRFLLWLNLVINFIEDVVNERFNHVTFLAILKSDFTKIDSKSLEKPAIKQKAIYLIEKMLFTKDCNLLSLEKIIAIIKEGAEDLRLKNYSGEDSKDNLLATNIIVDLLAKILQRTIKLKAKINHNILFDLAELSKVLIEIVELFADDSVVDVVAKQEEQEAINDFLNVIQKPDNITLPIDKFSKVFCRLASSISYFPALDYIEVCKENSGQFSHLPKIKLVSTIEARLLDSDLIIVTSLNDGNFPSEPKINWLGRQIESDIKIDHHLAQIGQNNYDFYQYLNCSKVILSRSMTQEGKERRCSFPLEKLLIFIKLIENSQSRLNYSEIFKRNIYQIVNFDSENVDFSLENKEAYVGNTKTVLKNKIKQHNFYRDINISITSAGQLTKNPFLFYATNILALRQLRDSNSKILNKSIGIALHKIIEKSILLLNQQKTIENGSGADATYVAEIERYLANIIENNFNNLGLGKILYQFILAKMKDFVMNFTKEFGNDAKCQLFPEIKLPPIILAESKENLKLDYKITISGRADLILLLEGGDIAVLDFKKSQNKAEEQMAFTAVNINNIIADKYLLKSLLDIDSAKLAYLDVVNLKDLKFSKKKYEIGQDSKCSAYFTDNRILDDVLRKFYNIINEAEYFVYQDSQDKLDEFYHLKRS